MSHNKIFAALVMAIAANSAMASTGTITFEGEIIAGTCTVTAANGGSGDGQSIKVSLGQVSKSDLGAAGQVATSAPFTLNLTCLEMQEGEKKVTMAFDAGNGSGTDAKNVNLLKVEGAAKGVGIGVFDKNNTMLNLAANPTISEKLVVAKDGTGTSTLQLRAGFVANGDAVVVGDAVGRLPFTLSYE